MDLLKKLNIPNASFLVVSPIVALFGSIWWFQSDYFNYNTLYLALILFSFQEISITAGYHRLFAHRAYEASLPVRLFFLIFGAGALQGPVLFWALDHREHHRYVDDNEKDPYSINKGFMWAHIVWLFFKKRDNVDLSRGPDLTSDKWVMLQEKIYAPFGLSVCLLLPTLIAMGWGDAIGGFLIAGALKITVNHHSTFLINSLSHCVGKQTYSDSHSARDNWFTAILTFGEGYHNYHHEFASDYRNGVKPHTWDPTKWLIFTLSKLGLAWNLKRIPQELILKKEMQMREKRLTRTLEKQINYTEAFAKYSKRLMTRLHTRINEEIANVLSLTEKYNKLIKSPDKRTVVIKYEIKLLEQQVGEAKQALGKSMQLWKAMTRKVTKLAAAPAKV